ncbi:MAG: MgtC/SapB family protein [Alicyclobacillus herbarius]|uniref:MgtC/SapB family protein n=1 Tax=Alicyclobacillus herbarius TaxID=122960 RepID=UPI0023522C5E|nr:MgtC/SapB family protein [Alicyclobacillus herbarius]MCL6632166.1 MgtC/SapB family protein [Alicyclobacillus herbarius]
MGIILIKLGLSALCGIVLGLEREIKHKPLGLKTCLVISVASCLLTIVSIESALNDWGGSQLVRADPMRLAAQIVSGIGFLGAGVILRRSNEVISGLTTAAIVWAASGLGIAIGAGYYTESLIGLALIIISVEVIPLIMKRVGPRALREDEVHVTVVVGQEAEIEPVVRAIEDLGMHVENLRVRGLENGHEVFLTCAAALGYDEIPAAYRKVISLPDVRYAEIEVL